MILMYILYYGAYVFWILWVISWFMRDVPIFKQIWAFGTALLLMLLIVLGINFTKKHVKNWWNS